MLSIIAAALGLLGTLAGIAWKWKAANSATAADKAAAAEATDANAMTKASANITDAARAAVQEQTDANQSNTGKLVAAVSNPDGGADGGLQSGADAIDAAIADTNRPAR